MNSQNESNLRNTKTVLNNRLSTVYALLKKRRKSRRKCSETVAMLLQYNQKRCPVTCNMVANVERKKKQAEKREGRKKTGKAVFIYLTGFMMLSYLSMNSPVVT